MPENGSSVSPEIDIDTMLQRSEWLQWRHTQQLQNPKNLAAAARAWCASMHWDDHTPQLEDWKLVVQDLRPERISEMSLTQMARGAAGKLPFPPIPLFEREQVNDICPLFSDVSALADFAQRLAKSELLLTVDPREAPKICWEHFPVTAKANLDYASWRWLFGDDDSEPKPWPSRDGVTAIWKVNHPRRAEAVRRLEEAARKTVDSGVDNPQASDVLRALSRMSERGGSEERSRASVRVEAPASESKQIRYERLCQTLFDGPFDVAQWAAIESEVEQRTAITTEPHPLLVMTRYLRKHDFPVQLDDNAWKKWLEVLKKYPGLLDVDAASRADPLPALELSASVNSMAPIGEIAVGLLVLADAQRRKSDWWAALKTGLQPMVRRGGWTLANDRLNRAISAVKSQVRWISRAEAQALETGFGKEKTYVGE